MSTNPVSADGALAGSCAPSNHSNAGSQPEVRDVAISVRGKWSTVPGIAAGEDTLIVRGNWIKTAVMHEEEWQDHEISDPESCIRSLKAERSPELRADLFAFTQLLPNRTPRYQYHTEWESVAAIPLTTYEAWWESLPQESRKNVRRAAKRGVVVKTKNLDDDLIAGIIGVNNDSPVRQNLPFAHYGKDFEQVKRDQSSFIDRSEFICAYSDDELIGFTKLVYRGEIASILQLLPKASHRDKRPANAMLAMAVEVCSNKGLRYLTYGLYNYGNKRESTLKDFKLRNGFREMSVPKYYVPLTRKGALCILLGGHRGLHAVLPPTIISVLVKARARWNSLTRKAGVA